MVSKASDLKAARAAFKELSLAMVDWAAKTKPQGYETYSCSMFPGKWVQKSGPIRNPYYGKEMLECGEKAH